MKKNLTLIYNRYFVIIFLWNFGGDTFKIEKVNLKSIIEEFPRGLHLSVILLDLELVLCQHLGDSGHYTVNYKGNQSFITTSSQN